MLRTAEDFSISLQQSQSFPPDRVRALFGLEPAALGLLLAEALPEMLARRTKEQQQKQRRQRAVGGTFFAAAAISRGMNQVPFPHVGRVTAYRPFRAAQRLPPRERRQRALLSR